MSQKSRAVRFYEEAAKRVADPVRELTLPVPPTPTTPLTVADIEAVIDGISREPETRTWVFGELSLRRVMVVLGSEPPPDIRDVTALFGYPIFHDAEHPWRAEFV